MLPATLSVIFKHRVYPLQFNTIIISVLFFLFSSSLFAFPLLYSEKGTHLYILKEPWCVLLLLCCWKLIFLSLGEKSIRLSSISVFPCVKQGNLLKTFLTMMSTGRWCGIWKLKNLHRNLKKKNFSGGFLKLSEILTRKDERDAFAGRTATFFTFFCPLESFKRWNV